MGLRSLRRENTTQLQLGPLPHGFSCVNIHSQQHVLVMCATAFYLIENYPLDVGPEFSASVIQVSGLGLPLEQEWVCAYCSLRVVRSGRFDLGNRHEQQRLDPEVFLLVQMCGVMLSGSEESTPSIIYHCVLRGLERLLLSEQLCRLDAESLVKLSVDRVNVHSPHRAMAALGLMLTCMYTGELRGPRSSGAGPPVSRRSVPLSSRPYGSPVSVREKHSHSWDADHRASPVPEGDPRVWSMWLLAQGHIAIQASDPGLGSRSVD